MEKWNIITTLISHEFWKSVDNLEQTFLICNQCDVVQINST